MSVASGLSISRSVVNCLRVPPPQNSWEWISQNGRTKKGRPFNYLDYPWMQGICEAWDNPLVRRIFLMMGSRMGKTELATQLMLCSQYHDPDVGMIVSPTEFLTQRTIGDRLWKVMEHITPMRPLLPPRHLRGKNVARAKTFTIYGGWSGSSVTLGDLDPKYLQCLEVDKFTTDKSDEADPLELALERGAEIPDRKVFAESTPNIEGVSRIATFVRNGWHCKLRVPCPHCDYYQVLTRNMGNEGEKGGLIWDRDNAGQHNASLAERSARYLCRRCEKEIPEDLRRQMIERGVWCAKGQSVDDRGRLVGRRENDGPDASFELSRIYTPTFTFASYARARAAAEGNSEKERSVDNNWDGIPWVPKRRKLGWEELAEKLCTDRVQLGVVPENCIFVTGAVDVQSDHFVMLFIAWNADQSGHCIAYGIAFDWDEVEQWLNSKWLHADGGPEIGHAMTFIDARDGNRKDEIVDFCRRINRDSGPWVFPSMGATAGSMQLKPFLKSEMDSDNKTQKMRQKKHAGFFVVKVNSAYWQDWMDNALYRRSPGDRGSISLPLSSRNDKDLFDQLLNETYDPSTGKWEEIDATLRSDYRDCFRYSRCAAEVYTNGNWGRIPPKRSVRKLTQQEITQRDSQKTDKPKTKEPANILRRTRRDNPFSRRRQS